MSLGSGVGVHPPAVIWQDKPWVFGNRTDAEKFADRPAGRAFLDDLPDDHMYLAKLGPYISCPLPIPPPEPAPSSDKDANQAAGPASGG